MPFERLQRRTTNRRRANRHYFRHVRFRSSPINTWKTSVREKKEIHRPGDDRPKKKKILTALLRSKRLGGGVLWERYPSHYNGLFSLLLVLRDFAATRQINIGLTPLHVSGSTSAGRVICGMDLAECVSVPGDFLRPRGAFPPVFYLLREGWVNRPAPEAPIIRGMPTGP